MVTAGKVVVSGYVRDASTGEELIGANVAVLETGAGSITNEYGFYSLSLPSGFYTLVFSYVGYVTSGTRSAWRGYPAGYCAERVHAGTCGGHRDGRGG